MKQACLPGAILLCGAAISVTVGVRRAEAQAPPQELQSALNTNSEAPLETKPVSFLATNPNIPRTLAFINGALANKIRFIGQHNPAGKVLLGKSQLNVKNDESRPQRRVVKFETPVMEDMSNGSDAPRSHLSVATALQGDLDVDAVSSSGEYVLVPCKAGKKCVDNRLLLASSYSQPPASLPGLGTLVRTVWAPPSVFAVGPFPDGQAEAMVPVVRYLLSK